MVRARQPRILSNPGLGWTVAALVMGASATVSVMIGSSLLHRRDTAVAADGTSVKFLGATYGTNQAPPGDLWGFWRTRLPEALAARLGLRRPWSHRTVRPELALWFRVAGPTPRLWDDELNAYGLVDRNGVELRRGFKRDLVQVPLAPGGARERRFALVTGAFPRRTHRIGLKLYLNAEGRAPRALDTSFVNPLRSVPAPWRPGQLPAASRTNGLETLLTSVNVTNAWLPAAESGNPASAYELEARFRFTQRGGPLNDWTVSGLVLEDAAGNQALANVVGEFATLAEGPTLVTRADVVLWPEEPAWKLRATLALRPEVVREGFGFRLAPIAVPPRTGYTQIGIQTNVGGVGVRVLALVGDQATYPGREHDVFGRFTLELDVTPLPPGLNVRVAEAWDDQGRRLEALTQSIAASGAVVLGLTIPADAKTVALGMGCFVPPTVEFVVPSPWPTAGRMPPAGRVPRSPRGALIKPRRCSGSGCVSCAAFSVPPKTPSN